jgi:RNA polymerase sigma-70 factor (ECF subfamily)
MAKKYSEYSDLELYNFILENKSNKELAFAELYNRYSRKIYFYCFRIIGNQQQAEDAFQETFLNFLQSINPDRVMTNIGGFILRIARNICHKHIRDTKKPIVSINDIDLSFNDESLEKKELASMVVASLELLSEEQRESLILQVYYDMSYAEIAEFLGVPVSTVRNWIVRSKRKVSKILAPYFERT